MLGVRTWKLLAPNTISDNNYLEKIRVLFYSGKQVTKKALSAGSNDLI